MKKLMVLLMAIFMLSSCVTKVQVIVINTEGAVILEVEQKGSEDALNGNEGKLKIPMIGG